MGDAGFLEIQFKPHVLEPLFSQALAVFDDGSIRV
jgi:hypothetical protein